MMRVNTLILGGGQAGLAMSRVLSELGIENVILERGRVGERWRSERWDSLRLLTPRWQSRLPGYRYEGMDPNGFMSRLELVDYLENYARSFDAPVIGGTTVTLVKKHPWGFRVLTDRGEWLARNVVIATGQAMSPSVPHISRKLGDDIAQIVPTSYRNPEMLPDGGVLVIGAAATGIQLASEIHASGRPVTLAVGAHSRMPRTYRGRDIMWWLDTIGLLGDPPHRTEGNGRRPEPSLHLIGSPDHRSIDLGRLQEEGIRLTGRAVSASRYRMRFADDLGESVRVSEARLERVLGRIDRYIEAMGPNVPAPEPIQPIPVPRTPAAMNLRQCGIKTVVWATGYNRSYPWLHLPVFDDRGEIRHHGGITAEPGLYAIGLHFLRRRNSTFVDGVGKDALELALHIAKRESIRKPAWFAAPEERYAVTRAS
jgi:putative flavoprotein involved in K+ transport